MPATPMGRLAAAARCLQWEWYFAFRQVGDESVAGEVEAYRAGLEQRDVAARALGWVLPSVGVQVLLTRLAGTDLRAQLAYQDRIRDYHRRLREFYYVYLFPDRPFGAGEPDRARRFRRISMAQHDSNRQFIDMFSDRDAIAHYAEGARRFAPNSTRCTGRPPFSSPSGCHPGARCCCWAPAAGSRRRWERRSGLALRRRRSGGRDAGPCREDA